jgi:hypothetical protein
MYQVLYKELFSNKNKWQNEEEVRQGWVIALNAALKINFQAERGKKDLSYNNVVIEFKDGGLFKGKITSPSFKVAIYERLLPYIIKTSKAESIDQSDYIGIAIDAEHICFAQVSNNKISHGHLLPLSEASVGMVATALKDSYRRALIAENLIEDFGHSSECGIKIMKALGKSLSKSINDPKINKTKMLFEEWRTLFGQVADLSSEQIDSINKTLGFKIDTSKNEKIPGALFVIHTFNSLIIKLLAAEIVSTHKLTSYSNFSQNLSVETNENILRVLDHEIERANYFSSAGIDGFVEEALFSWYIDACNNKDDSEEILSAIKDILIKLSFYRTDNLTQARSKDLLKLFYQNLVPETLRKTLGEFYTPDWLVSFTLDRVKNINWLENRSLDPTCGSGSFLLEIIKRKTKAAEKSGWSNLKILKHISTSVWGFDLNPLAVQTARVNFLIAIADLLEKVPGTRIEIPILLADAIYSPARDPHDDEDVVKYKIGSQVADLEITIPSELAFDRKRLDDIFEILGNSIENDLNYTRVEKQFILTKTLSAKEVSKWKSPLENTYNKVLKLHKNNWNGIWFRIIRNFFWSSTAGKFDLIAGNPPWVRWSKLPALYRERVKPTCLQYNIFSKTPHHGGNELDISGMITYTVSDKWLKENGTLAFIITQTHFQSPSSEGFRDFKINDSFNLNPILVDDMKALKPFPDATNKTAVTIFKKEAKKETKYPVKYNIWDVKETHKKAIPVNLTIVEALKRMDSVEFEATPVTANNSPWAILPKGRFKQLNKLIGKCDWVQGRKGITADLNGIYFVEILEENKSNKLVKIRTRPEAGKTNIGPAKEFWVESDLLYPLIKGASDFTRCHFNKGHSLFVFVPNKGIVKKAYEEAEDKIVTLKHTSIFFNSYKSLLKERSTFRGRMKNAPFYAIYNVGEYTFSPWKVIWAEQKDFCAAVVSKDNTPFIGQRPFIPDHKVFFADFNKPEPAYFLCGLLNSDVVIEYVKSHNISIQIGDIFKHMKLPKYESKKASHKSLVALVKKSHKEKNDKKRSQIISKMSIVAAKIIGI